MVTTGNGRMIILDAGSGVRGLAADIKGIERVDVLLSHLHMDHVQGLPFLEPLLAPEVRVDIWGPISTTKALKERLALYLSPPLFPVRLRDLENVWFHDVPPGVFEVDTVSVTADLICHPGPTLGFRLEEAGATLAYLPDHEPALGARDFPGEASWTSGHDLAQGATVLIHDSQYTEEQYLTRVGWGHSSYRHLLDFAAMTGVGTLVTFHHDPSHSDEMLDEVHRRLAKEADTFELVPGKAGLSFDL